jgi:hypothetical protein
VEPGALSGLPPGIWAVPSDFGAAELGAAPLVDGITTVPLTGGAGERQTGYPLSGLPTVNTPEPSQPGLRRRSTVRMISFAFRVPPGPSNADLKRRLLTADDLRDLTEGTSV